MQSYVPIFVATVVIVLVFVIVWLSVPKSKKTKSKIDNYDPTFTRSELQLIRQNPERWWDKGVLGYDYGLNPQFSGLSLSNDSAIRAFPLSSFPLPTYLPASYPVSSKGKYARNIPTTPYTIPNMEFTSADIQNFPWNASYFGEFGDVGYPYI